MVVVRLSISVTFGQTSKRHSPLRVKRQYTDGMTEMSRTCKQSVKILGSNALVWHLCLFPGAPCVAREALLELGPFSALPESAHQPRQRLEGHNM